MRDGLFAPTAEGEARLLLLIGAFSKGDGHVLQGRTKLAKLDFLLRYPAFFERAMRVRGRDVPPENTSPSIEQRMVRYRYGPWDPAYYALLGSLIGRGLVTTVPQGRYLGLRLTPLGQEAAGGLAATPEWLPVAKRAAILRTEFPTQTGSYLKDFVYEHFPEVAGSSWGGTL